MSWLTDCAEHLEDTISTYTVGTNIFYNFLPDTPDAAICVYDAGGSMTPAGPDCPLQACNLEVRVRGTSDANAASLMASVTSALHGKVGATWNTTTAVRWCRLDSEPAYFKTDQLKRVIYLARYQLQVGRSSYKSG